MAKILFSFLAFVLLTIQLQAQDMYRVKADKLRVRADKDTKSKVIGNIAQNENVTVLDASDAKFYKVKFKSGAGWVSKDFLEKIAPAAAKPIAQPSTASQPETNTAATEASNDIYRVTTDNLRVREKADPKSKVVGYLPENENVAVLDSTNTSFFKIKVKNGEGWVSKEFLVRVSPPSKPVAAKTPLNVEVPQTEHDYSSIIFFAVVAIILFLILFLVFKYASQSKILIGILTIVILTTAYFCYITFVMKKTVAGTFTSDSETQYQSFDFSTKDSVIVKDIYADSTFTSKYIIDGDMIKLYDQQNTILLLIRDENTLIGEGFTKGTFIKK
jgi:uncharacterized protein YgiM (DUF1202 family)